MMTSKRADPMDGMDFTDFEGEPAARPAIPVEAIREASEQRNFPSRAAQTPSPQVEPVSSARREQRRHRTGRNQQLNLKVSDDVAKRFTSLAAARGWVLGEALEKAVELLEANYPVSR